MHVLLLLGRTEPTSPGCTLWLRACRSLVHLFRLLGIDYGGADSFFGLDTTLCRVLWTAALMAFFINRVDIKAFFINRVDIKTLVHTLLLHALHFLLLDPLGRPCARSPGWGGATWTGCQETLYPPRFLRTLILVRPHDTHVIPNVLASLVYAMVHSIVVWTTTLFVEKERAVCVYVRVWPSGK